MVNKQLSTADSLYQAVSEFLGQPKLKIRLIYKGVEINSANGTKLDTLNITNNSQVLYVIRQA